jgi:hypothetical protein
MGNASRKQVNAILRKSLARAKHVKRQKEIRREDPETCICGVPGCHLYPPASRLEAKQK